MALWSAVELDWERRGGGRWGGQDGQRRAKDERYESERERKRRGEMEDGWRGGVAGLRGWATWKRKRAAAGLKLGQSAINGVRQYRAGTLKCDSVCRPRSLPTCVHPPRHVSHVFSRSKDIFDQVRGKQVHFEKDHMCKPTCPLHLITETNLDLPLCKKKKKDVFDILQ